MHREPAVHLDHRRDVAPVAVSELRVDLVVDRVELLAELFDLLVGEARERALDVVVSFVSAVAVVILSSCPDLTALKARSRCRPRGR